MLMSNYTCILSEFVTSNPSWVLADIHWLNPGGSQSLPAATHLHSRPDPPLHKQEDRRDATTHICNSRQLLLQHAAKQQGPVLHHQVCVCVCTGVVYRGLKQHTYCNSSVLLLFQLYW